MTIYRYIGNDSGTTAQYTLGTLKQYEPKVGNWPGDIIEYSRDGYVIDIICT